MNESSGRAYVNPYTNVMFLEPDFGALTGERMIMRGVPQFMHEAMHQWCFDSPVGIAIAMLDMRARRRALAEGDACSAGVFFDAGRYMVALEMLRPLAEGLALFAEHDIVPGDSAVISRPSLLASTFFGAAEPEIGIQRLPAILACGRLHLRHARRKADLLSQPLACDDGGYLAGYLTIKSMYESMVLQCRRYFDSDLWAHCVRCGIYDDWTLVHMLLSPLEPEDFANLIFAYLRKRLVDITTLDHDEVLDDFERRGTAGDADMFAHLTPHYRIVHYAHPLVPSQLADEAKAMLARLMDDLFAETADADSLQVDVATLALRSSLTVASTTVQGRITEHRVLEVLHDDLDGWIKLGPAPDELPADFRSSLECELVYQANPPGKYRVILVDGRVVQTSRIAGDHKLPLPTELVSGLVDRKVRERLHAAGARAIESVVTNRNTPLSVILYLVKVNRQHLFVNGAIPGHPGFRWVSDETARDLF